MEGELEVEVPLFRARQGFQLAFRVQEEGCPQEPSERAKHLAMGHRLARMLEEGQAEGVNALARRLGMSPGRVSVLVDLAFLAPDLQEAVLVDRANVAAFGLETIIRLARLRQWAEQRQTWERLRKERGIMGPTSNETLAAEARAMRELAQELAGLERMGLRELQARYCEILGEEPRSRNLVFLRKKLAFRIQERMEGGLSPRAQALITELAPAELPLKSGRVRKVEPSKEPKPVAEKAKIRDPRLPAPGTVLIREYQHFAHEVEVLEEGFRYRGRSYASLSTIAKEITGTAWNGFLFFKSALEALRG